MDLDKQETRFMELSKRSTSTNVRKMMSRIFQYVRRQEKSPTCGLPLCLSRELRNGIFRSGAGTTQGQCLECHSASIQQN